MLSMKQDAKLQISDEKKTCLALFYIKNIVVSFFFHNFALEHKM